MCLWRAGVPVVMVLPSSQRRKYAWLCRQSHPGLSQTTAAAFQKTVWFHGLCSLGCWGLAIASLLSKRVNTMWDAGTRLDTIAAVLCLCFTAASTYVELTPCARTKVVTALQLF